MHAAALVVGIDAYRAAEVPGLNGCVEDAIHAVNWLLGLGVPADNIFLHAEPAPPSTATGGVVVQPAGSDAIWDSMLTLSEGRGDQLFIFFSGHGLHLGPDGPIFLTADYSRRSTKKNLAIDAHLRWFQSWPYRDQFVFYDACQNTIASVGQIAPVQAQPPQFAAGTYTPLITNAQTVCWSASPGQRAYAGDGRGVMMRKILAQLDVEALAALSPDAQQQDAILYNWDTGARVVDLKPLFDNLVAPEMEAEAASAHLLQTPVCQQFGRALSEARSPILTLPGEPATALRITVSPATAVGAVHQLKLMTTSPHRSLYRPGRAGPVTATFSCLAPKGGDLIASCIAKPGSPWRSANSPLSVKLDQNEVKLELKLDQPPGSVAPEDGQFNLRVMDEDGAPQLIDFGSELGLPAVGSALKHGLGPGVSIRFEPSGLDITFNPHFNGSQEAARGLAYRMLGSIRQAVAPSGLQVLASPPGQSPNDLKPNLRFDLPSTEVAGFLAEAPLVVLSATDGGDFIQYLSIRDIANHPLERVDPGAYRVSLELPWARWTTRLTVNDDAQTVCALPERVGLEPMRNIWRREGHKSDRVVFLSADLHRSAQSYQRAPNAEGEFFMLGAFPIDLLVEAAPQAPRVEPFSRSTLPEWDLLFSAGRPEAISNDRLRRLIDSELEDAVPERGARDLFLLGLAYTALARGDPKTFDLARYRLRHSFHHTLDYDLIDLEHPSSKGDMRTREDLRNRIRGYQELPTLSWGLSLTRQLFDEVGEVPPLWIDKAVPSSPWMIVDQETYRREQFRRGAEIHVSPAGERPDAWFEADSAQDDGQAKAASVEDADPHEY